MFQPLRIVLAKGSDSTVARARMAEQICKAYPKAEILDRTDLPHTRIDLDEAHPLARHTEGKRTLVLGEHRSAVRFSEEQENCCPNYWHFSPYGFCPYGCTYCYLAGTRGVWFSPTVKIFLNLDDILTQIDRIARREARPTAFYLGKLQDGLALDPLTGYSRQLVPFFRDHPYARLIVLTKAADVSNLLDLDSGGQTILSWSLCPSEITSVYEPNTPPPANRLDAMRLCGSAGYRLRAVIMPILPVPGWQGAYRRLLDSLLTIPQLERITLGSICSFPNAIRLMEQKVGKDNDVVCRLAEGRHSEDGRYRFTEALRTSCYQFLIEKIRRSRPAMDIGLCLEDLDTFSQMNMQASIGRCNCVL
jgi:spore photoproduct lyase